MRALALIVVFLSLPAFAADYSAWTGPPQEPAACQLLAQTVEGYCCLHCPKGTLPCGRGCIAPKAICNAKPGGCACPYGAP